MKFLATVLVFTAMAAQAKEIAHYRFAVQDYATNEVVHVEATLEDTKELHIEAMSFLGRGHGPIFFPSEVKEDVSVTKNLNKYTYEILFNKVKNLANAQIKTTYQQIVCTMMPGPEASNNHLTVRRNWDWDMDDFIGEMELISGPSGCWVSTSVQPDGDWGKRHAYELKEVLKTLALETIEL
ncbi:MAG: hypothetical protein CMH26_05810 [Micavibrio sp.]|nr:hypothetical protein [Micavibrio sp.]